MFRKEQVRVQAGKEDGRSKIINRHLPEIPNVLQIDERSQGKAYDSDILSTEVWS
jgi:hypothetical protein